MPNAMWNKRENILLEPRQGISNTVEKEQIGGNERILEIYFLLLQVCVIVEG